MSDISNFTRNPITDLSNIFLPAPFIKTDLKTIKYSIGSADKNGAYLFIFLLKYILYTIQKHNVIYFDVVSFFRQKTKLSQTYNNITILTIIILLAIQCGIEEATCFVKDI